MSAKSDQVKGHAKEAAGIVVDDSNLESEGKTQRLSGEAAERFDHAKDKADELIDKAKDKAEELLDTTKDKLDEVIDKTKDTLHR